MTLAPEAQILILNATIMAIAYLGIYPTLQDKKLATLMNVDLVLSMLALTAAGALFWGSGIKFNLLFLNVNWAIFTVVTLIAMELPLFLRFARKHGIKLWDDDD